MASAVSDSNAPVMRARRWPWLMIGVLLFVSGPVVYALQVGAGRLQMPWYLPVLATCGVLLMAVSVWQRRGIVRSVALAVFVLLCGSGWYFVLVASKTPLYVGPAQPGNKLPPFTAALADGRPWTEGDLERGERSVLLFFRGRW
jgi:hypothetical protein